MDNPQRIETDAFFAEAFDDNSIIVTSMTDPFLSVLIKMLPTGNIILYRQRGNSWDIREGPFEKTSDGIQYEPSILVRKM